MNPNNTTAVFGLGNPLMADEGIGCAIVEKLCEMKAAPNVDFIDAGTGGLALLHMFQGRNKAIIVDCALMGKTPGQIIRFTPDQVQTVKQLAHLSLHEADILKVIELAKELGQCPEEIIFFGIEPTIITQRIGLSQELENKMDDYISAIIAELNP